MAHIYQASTWSVELPSGWTAETRPDHVAVRPPSGADVRFTSAVLAGSQLDATAWVEAAAHFDRVKRRRVDAVSCGDFRGYETGFTEDGRHVHGWALAAGELPLDVTYRGPDAPALIDVASLSRALATLRRAAG